MFFAKVQQLLYFEQYRYLFLSNISKIGKRKMQT